MMYFIDSADTEAIKRCCEYFPISGVTTNPTIVSREKRDFRALLCSIREIIGEDRIIHVQTTASKAEDILREAETIKSVIGGSFYVKIPITREGMRAVRLCRENGFNVTVTAVFTQPQALMAATAGADFVAPFVNRLDNIASDGVNTVREIVELFRINSVSARVLAASFKNVEQIHRVSMAGVQAVTLSPELFDMLISHPLTDRAMEIFGEDWIKVYGNNKLPDLLR